MSENIILGGGGANGSVSVRGGDGQPLVELLARSSEAVVGVGQANRPGRLTMYDGNAEPTVSLTTADATLALGGAGVAATVSVLGADGQPSVQLISRSNECLVGLGQPDRPGRVSLYGPDPLGAGNSQEVVRIDAALGTMVLGGPGAAGTLSVHGGDGQPMVELLSFPDEAVIGVGQTNRPGRLTMYDSSAQTAVYLTSDNATLLLGGGIASGTISVLGAGGQGGSVQLVSQPSDDSGRDAAISVVGADGQPSVELISSGSECIIGLGQQNRAGRISLYGADQQESIRLDATAGDIVLANADCAEEFDLAVDLVEPGTVVVLTGNGEVTPSMVSYDTRVAGVVSGAGRYRPALVLDRQRGGGRQRAPIALSGKVYCRVDATAFPVRVGDLLTTSSTPGHAMRASDPTRAFGAVIGKAMQALNAGRDLIPILVALQ